MRKILLVVIFFLLSLEFMSIVALSYSILIISPKIVKILEKENNLNNIYSNPSWANGTAIVEKNTSYETIYGLDYSYAVQKINISSLSNFTYAVRYDYISGIQAGAIILGGNVELDKPANIQPYVLIYSVVSGELLIKTPTTTLKSIIKNLPSSVSGILIIHFTDVEGNLTITTISLDNSNVTLVYITPIPWSSIKYAGWLQDEGFSFIYYLSEPISLAETIPMIAGSTFLVSNIVSSPIWKLGTAKVVNYTNNYEILEGESGGSYIVQYYNISPLRYFIVSSNFTYYNGSNVGIELLGSNIDLSEPDNQQIYALLYSVNNGILWIEEPSKGWHGIKSGLPVIKNGIISLLLLNNDGNVSLYEIIVNKTLYFINITTPIPWNNITYVGWRVDNGFSKLIFMPQNYIVIQQTNLVFEFLNNNGTPASDQKYYIYIGNNLTYLQFYSSGYTNSDGMASILLPIIYSTYNNYEYIRIIWVNKSVNVTLIIPLIQYKYEQLDIPLNPFNLNEEKINIKVNYLELALFLSLIIVLLMYLWEDKIKGK
jgi:hypothetical protein